MGKPAADERARYTEEGRSRIARFGGHLAAETHLQEAVEHDLRGEERALARFEP
jgi:hypothetical protein